MQATSGFNSVNAKRLSDAIVKAKTAMEKLSEQEWTDIPAPGKWSRKQVLGHLVDSASNNHLRFVRAQLCEKEFVSLPTNKTFTLSGRITRILKRNILSNYGFPTTISFLMLLHM